MAVESRRQRRSWTRTTRGCKTCRSRHVKCDETYPSCRRCAIAGRACDGCKEPTDAWEVQTLSSISPSPERRSYSMRNDDKANVSFAFFQLQTLDYLADLSGQAWKALVLRAAEQNDAIYHAALAVGSMHRTVLSQQVLSTDLHDDEYAVKQYTHSLRKLAAARNVEDSDSVAVVLAACVLYIGFESLRRNHGVVLEHVRSGVRIIQQHTNNATTDRKEGIIPLRHFIPAFARLERQAQELTGMPSSLIQALVTEQEATGYFRYRNPSPQPVPSFSTLDDAWRGLHQRWHSLLRWVEDVQRDMDDPGSQVQDLGQRKTGLEEDFRIWSLGLKTFGSRNQNLAKKDASIYALLECHVLLADMVIANAGLRHETRWDKYVDNYRRIVDVCRAVIQSEEDEARNSGDLFPSRIVIQHRYTPDPDLAMSETDPQKRCPLTFDMSICMILLHTVQKCREARVRLNAIRLLEEHPRLEGLWDGLIIAQIGRAIDMTERNGASLEAAAARGACASEILEPDRVVKIDGGLNGKERHADLILVQQKGEQGCDRTELRHVLSW